VAVGPFADIVDAAAAVKFGELHGFPYMLKARLGAYDGKVYFVDIYLEFSGLCVTGTSLHTSRSHGIAPSVCQYFFLMSVVPFTKWSGLCFTQGNCKVDSAAECAAAFASMGGNGSGGCYAEKWCAFTTEIAVMVLNAPSLKEPRCFPVVDFTSVSSILFSTRCPAELSAEMEAKARQVAIAAVKCLPDESYGVFGVEMFALTSGKIVLNEVPSAETLCT
jgi:phosphoribosylaminoimidazole carboxylase (NCAIR synthetase)